MGDKNIIAAAEAAIAAADGAWLGWDWPHDPAGIVVYGPGRVADWDAWERERAASVTDEEIEDARIGCGADAISAAERAREAAAIAAAERAYGEAAQDAAEEAQDELRAARVAVAEGRYADALEHAERAQALEDAYGDAPVYAPVAEALQELVEVAQ